MTNNVLKEKVIQYLDTAGGKPAMLALQENHPEYVSRFLDGLVFEVLEKELDEVQEATSALRGVEVLFVKRAHYSPEFLEAANTEKDRLGRKQEALEFARRELGREVFLAIKEYMGNEWKSSKVE